MTALQLQTQPETPRHPSHTPGPFFFYRDADGVDDLYVIKSTVTDQNIATILFWDDEEEWPLRALGDARLLTAAPELLHALKRVLAVLADIPGGMTVDAYEAESIAVAAVAKAERDE